MNNVGLEERILNILGKNISSTEVKNFISELNETPEIAFADFGLPDDKWEYDFFENGLHLRFDQNYKLTAVYIYFVNYDQYKKFDKYYNEFISHDITRDQILAKLGKPNRENPKIYYSLGTLTPVWMAYYFDKYTLRYEFQGDENNLSKINIMLPEATPGRNI